MANNPQLRNFSIDEKQIAHTKAIVYSMTPAEREDESLLNPSRRRRIAAGSGVPIVEVNRMIKEFKTGQGHDVQGDQGELQGLGEIAWHEQPDGQDGHAADGEELQEEEGQENEEGQALPLIILKKEQAVK